jgi:hypothetical protein
MPEPDRLRQMRCAALEDRIGALLIEQDLDPALVLRRIVLERPATPVTEILYVFASFYVSLGELPHGSAAANAERRQALLEQIAGTAAELYALEFLGFPAPPRAADLARYWEHPVAGTGRLG